MQGAYPSGIFAGITLERSVIKSQPGNGCSCGGSSVDRKKASMPPLHLYLSICVLSPKPDALVAFIMTRKAWRTSSFIQNGVAMLK